MSDSRIPREDDDWYERERESGWNWSCLTFLVLLALFWTGVVLLALHILGSI